MNLVRFLKEYKGSILTYEKFKIYGADTIEDDGSGLLTIYINNGDNLFVAKKDVEILSGNTTKAVLPPIKSCCSEEKLAKAKEEAKASPVKLNPAKLNVKKKND